ncbi:MAG: pyrimidine dimer DNA glycosylase/endonuclease V [Nanoarchaeota archaeon]|nr:pyrimidine dimer DNA glycosylase/endonuclease V [Nanoarchaeota archaeon]
MVRINIINPKKLADQHLIAEYNEILKLIGHIKKYPIIKNQPKNYCLGKGHINFFKDKIKYLKIRHKIIKKEMKKRGFKANKTINLNKHQNNWKPKQQDYKIIKKRLKEKIKLKPNFYRYYKTKKPVKFFNGLLK